MTKYSSADSTKMAIIQAAGELAAERGFNNVSTRAVAERSKENIGSIHYHFGGKDGLFEAVIREAMSGCCRDRKNELLAELGETPSPLDLSCFIREIISSEITDMFRSDRPAWHVPVIYQLLQRDDHLHDIFYQEMMVPSMEAMDQFFRFIDPDMEGEAILLHIILMKMPILAHANSMKTMLKLLGADEYPEDYLQKMEDMLVRQTLLLLGLPEDKPKELILEEQGR